jgi:hypothetical protein
MRRTRATGLTLATLHASVPPAARSFCADAPRYFRRFPALWRGLPHDGGPMWMAVSESGIPLPAAMLGVRNPDARNRRQAVLRVIRRSSAERTRDSYADPRDLGFFGPGRQWADLLLY